MAEVLLPVFGPPYTDSLAARQFDFQDLSWDNLISTSQILTADLAECLPLENRRCGGRVLKRIHCIQSVAFAPIGPRAFQS